MTLAMWISVVSLIQSATIVMLIIVNRRLMRQLRGDR